MRILLVTPLFLPSLSGAAVYFDTLSQEFVALDPGADVTILTRAVAGAPRQEWRGRVRVLRSLPAAGHGRLAALRAAAIVLLTSWRLHSEVVHYHTLASYRGLHLLAPLFRAPLVGDMRDLAAKNEGASLANYRHCRRLICASENIAAFVRSQGVRADRIVHIPIPFRRPPPAAADRLAAARARHGVADGPYVLFVGAVIPYKGVRELLGAMDIVGPRAPELRLALAGPLTPEGDALFPGGFRAFVAERPRVHWLGPVAHDDVLLLLQGAEVFVLPSRTEGLPRAGLEALALGARVVLPPGIPEFDAACPEAVLEAITAEAIAAKIELVRRRPRSTTYPVDRHDATRVSALTLEVYRAARGG